MDTFDRIFNHLLEFEGEYSNDPDDPGGETKYGISKRTYPRVDIANLTKEQAKEIYRVDFWERYKCHMINSKVLAADIFLAVVNMNPVRAIRYLQTACNAFGANIVVDGKIGPKTISWINSYKHPKALIAAFEGEMYQHYKNQNAPKFLAGWLIRSDADLV